MAGKNIEIATFFLVVITQRINIQSQFYMILKYI